MSFKVPTGYTMYRIKSPDSGAPSITNTYQAGTTVSDSPYMEYVPGPGMTSYAIYDVLVNNTTGVYYEYNIDEEVDAGLLKSDGAPTICGLLHRDCSPIIGENDILATTFGNKPIVTIYAESAPVVEFSAIIPDTVRGINFGWCHQLERFNSPIPQNIEYLYSTFNSCENLTGTIVINTNTESYSSCFKDTTLPIILTGESEHLKEIARTGNNGNVTVYKDFIPRIGLRIVI